MLLFTVIILFFSGFLEFPSITTSITSPIKDSNFPIKTAPDPFTDLFIAFKKWDSQVVNGDGGCSELKMQHVSVLVKWWTWIPSNLDNLYSCRCWLSCLWTKSSVLADKPDALLFETAPPPFQFKEVSSRLGDLDDVSWIKEKNYFDKLTKHECCSWQCFGILTSVYKNSRIAITLAVVNKEKEMITLARRNGDPLHVYMDLEAGRKRSGHEDLFISYHAEDDVQSTYAGDTLVYWSSSRCLADRNQLAKSLLSLLPHHSFGKCLNNVGGLDMALSFYPECANDASVKPKWWDHLHCAMSHYKFVLAIENTWTESYVTEKLFYALDSGAVPIYFGAPNVLDFVPPHSIIDGTKFSSKEELASYLKNLANDPVAYGEYHAWRRCGVLGNYGKTRAASLDTLPCRLCEAVSRKGGREARA
ncbi:alpha-(1,4)-fucosyltransferase-like [Populus alba]|uniref:alpha-(1,4)-fucosyltransferase-like n=1 Tax=Populus alba TaxID=43335 RepID=UPI003CC781FC